MASIGELFVTLKLKGEDFQKGITRAQKELKSFADISKKTALAVGALGAGVVLLARPFVQAASAAEQYNVRLKVLLGSQREGTRLFKEMSAYASRVPFEYRDIMSSATALSGVMRGGVNEIKQWMPLIGDLAAASGMSIQETTEQVIRMYSAGAASADKFRERGILAMLGFQAGVSYSAEETRKKLMEAWNKTDSQFRGATDELAGTWEGLTSMMADAWFKLQTEVMDAGVFEFLKDLVRELTPLIGELASEIVALTRTMVANIGGAKQYANVIRDIGYAAVWTVTKLVQLATESGKFWAEWAHGSDSVLNRNTENLKKMEEEVRAIDNRLGTAEFMNLGLSKKDQLALAGRRSFLEKNIELTQKTIEGIKNESKAIRDYSNELFKAAKAKPAFTEGVDTGGGVIPGAAAVAGSGKGAAKAAKELSRIMKDVTEDLKFIWDGYYEYRLGKIEEEAQEFQAKTGDSVLAEKWKAEQIKSLDEERAEYQEKQANRSLKSWLQSGKNILNNEKRVQQNALQLWKSYEESTVAFKQESLQQSIKIMQEAGLTETEIWEAVKDTYIKIEEEKLAKSNNLFDGIRVGFLKLRQSATTWAQAGYSAVNWFATNASNAMGQSFVAIVKGQWDELGNIWDNFLNSMLNALVNTVTQMIIEWSVLKLLGVGGGFSIGGGYTYPQSGGGLISMATNTAMGYGAYSGISALIGGAGLGAGALGAIGTGLGASTAISGAFAGAAASGSIMGASSGVLATLGTIAPYALPILLGGALLFGGGDIFGGIGDVFGGIGDFVGDIGDTIGDFFGGLFASGTPFVEKDMLAGIHKGERILSSDHNERLVMAVESLASGGGGATIIFQGDIYSAEETLRKIDQGLRRLGQRRHG